MYVTILYLVEKHDILHELLIFLCFALGVRRLQNPTLRAILIQVLFYMRA